MPKLEDEVVLVPGSLALVLNLVVSGHANNFLVNNVSRALVSRLVVKFAGEILQDTNAFDIYKLFEDLFLPKAQRENMYLEGIQTEELCKIRSNSGDKKTTGVDAEKKLNTVYGNKYRIPLDHEILKDHGVFNPSALHNALIFKITLAPANMVVKGSDASELNYELTNIQLEYNLVLTNTPTFMSEPRTGPPLSDIGLSSDHHPVLFDFEIDVNMKESDRLKRFDFKHADFVSLKQALLFTPLSNGIQNVNSIEDFVFLLHWTPMSQR